MLNLLDSSFFIPSLPFCSTFLLGIFLVSFSRTINRLTKPVSFLLITSFLISTLYSAVLLYKHIFGEVVFHPLDIIGLDFSFNLIFNDTSEIYLIILGSIAIILLLASYLRLPRKTGYVRYILSLAFLFSLSFVYVLNNQSFNISRLIS